VTRSRPPAGSGKTWVLAAAGQAWAAARLGRVIGITPSQSARNTLAAGVPVSYNCAQFLGHLPGQRGARGPVQLNPGDLILMDDASMVATPDLADVITQAAAAGAKVILAGDTQQLQAVENGGGMSLLADALGYAQLTEPVRFHAAWEQAASLRLRTGDTVLDRHGQLLSATQDRHYALADADHLAILHAIWTAETTPARATAEAEAAQRRGQPEEAARQQALASGYRAMHDAYRDREATFGAAMADRADWDAATRHQRHLAVAADTELPPGRAGHRG
jgi:ATP-dependent exoDNAse (exonuclease V) alpha subunit